MKKNLTAKAAAAMLLALAMIPGASALAADREAALATAQALAGPGATLGESDREDGHFEFELSDDLARYDVLVDAQSGRAVCMETAYRGVKKAEQAALDEAAARAAVTALSPQAQIHHALLERDGGKYEWNVFYTLGGDAMVAAVQAQTGEIRRLEAYYGAAASILTADKAVEALAGEKPGAQVAQLDIDYDEDSRTLRYEGTAQLDGRMYEFELTAAHGDIVKWERD